MKIFDKKNHKKTLFEIMIALGILVILFSFYFGITSYNKLNKLFDDDYNYTWSCSAWADNYCNEAVPVNVSGKIIGYYPRGLFEKDCEKYCMTWSLRKEGFRAKQLG